MIYVVRHIAQYFLIFMVLVSIREMFDALPSIWTNHTSASNDCRVSRPRIWPEYSESSEVVADVGDFGAWGVGRYERRCSVDRDIHGAVFS